MTEMKLEDLKLKSPTEMLSFAEENGVENASTMRKQELMFATLKQLAAKEIEITGTGVVEVLQDGFGFLRSPDANYLPGPDDIYVSPSQIRRFALRSGDTVEGQIRSPKDGERYFALLEGQQDQLRRPRGDEAQDPLRQPHAALPHAVAQARDRRSDRQGSLRPRHRHRRADRQGPARPDRRPAAHRQDGAAAEHRPLDHHQSPRVLPHRAAHRRAARGGHRHAALGEGRGHLLDLRRAALAPRAGLRDGDREGQAPRRAQARRGDPPWIPSPASAAPTTPSCRPPARC